MALFLKYGVIGKQSRGRQAASVVRVTVRRKGHVIIVYDDFVAFGNTARAERSGCSKPGIPPPARV